MPTPRITTKKPCPNITQAYNIIVANCPQKIIYPVKVFQYSRNFLRSLFRKCKHLPQTLTYKQLIEYYSHVYSHSNYIRNIPWMQRNLKQRRFATYNINAASTYPIYLNAENLEHQSIKYICFIILHEFAHLLSSCDEENADKFALAWINRLIKKGVIL